MNKHTLKTNSPKTSTLKESNALNKKELSAIKGGDTYWVWNEEIQMWEEYDSQTNKTTENKHLTMIPNR